MSTAMRLECVVCGTVLTSRAPGGQGLYPVCHAVPCRMVLDQRATLGEAAFQQRLRLQARNTRAQRERAREEDRQLQAQSAAEAAENAVHWAALEVAMPGQNPDRFIKLTLPSGPARTTHLAERRRRRYRDHLNQVLAEALMLPEPPPSSSPADPDHPSALPGRLCALCRGGCCTRGADTAYLSAGTLRRFMALHPALRPRQVLSAYLDRLGHRTQSGSCINHTAQGCSLPRDMRSDICNRYLCGSQEALQGRLAEPLPPLGVLVVQRRQDHWNRHSPRLDNGIVGGALVTEAGITPWPDRPDARQK